MIKRGYELKQGLFKTTLEKKNGLQIFRLLQDSDFDMCIIKIL